MPDHPKGLRTWIEIDRKALEYNYELFRSLIPKKTRLLGVVKSNAYGHNLVDLSRELEKLGIDFLGVDSFIEGIRLRKSGLRSPILVLGHTLIENFEEAAANDISLTISSVGQLELIRNKKMKKFPKIHIKVDTGMNRQGFMLTDMKKVANFLKKNRAADKFAIEGLFTHFAGAKAKSKDRTPSQLKQFKKWTDLFHSLGVFPILHAAATGGTLLFPAAHLDMVRIGIGMYGIYPSSPIEEKFKNKLRLRPVLSWRTVLSEIKSLPKRSRVGYDGTEILKRTSVVAVCPVGYWHGLPRALSSKGTVLIRGKRARILGRVSMDMITVDVTDIPRAKIGDTATLIGTDGELQLRAEDIAKKMPGSSAYELVTRLNPLIKRILT